MHLRCALFLAAAVSASWGATLPEASAAAKYSVRTAKSEPPKELAAPLAKLLDDNAIHFLDEEGARIAEIWLRREIPAQATPEQVKNGLTYREFEEGTLFGVLRVEREMRDYRRQRVRPGLYTMRLGFQPMDGDHMGTAPHGEFFLLAPAGLDKDPAPVEVKELRERSNQAAKTSHPAVLLLFPNPKPLAVPQLTSRENEHWVLNFQTHVKAGGENTVLGVGLTLVGHSPTE